jgi:methionyl-tRNA synthetase
MTQEVSGCRGYRNSRERRASEHLRKLCACGNKYIKENEGWKERYKEGKKLKQKRR